MPKSMVMMSASKRWWPKLQGISCEHSTSRAVGVWALVWSTSASLSRARRDTGRWCCGPRASCSRRGASTSSAVSGASRKSLTAASAATWSRRHGSAGCSAGGHTTAHPNASTHMKTIRWGMIGCGDVSEIKSGPGFYKADHSRLVAVMRRNGQLAADYARRHDVSRWHDDAQRIIDDPDIDAVYIATLTDSHREYTLRCAGAGKAVYVEKT